MEKITLTLLLDPGYRRKLERYDDVNFDDYLIGVLLEHLLAGGQMDKLLKRIDQGSVAARSELHNRSGVGKVMRGIVEI